MKDNKILRISVMGLFIALCYVGVLFNIPIRFANAETMIHFGNIFCLLGAMILGGVYGGLAGALGMSLFDLTNAGWQLYAPQTFILKLCIGLICGFVFQLLIKKGAKHPIAAVIASIAAVSFNVIASPIASYLTKKYLVGVPSSVAKIFAAWESLATFINAILAVIIATVVYSALSAALKKSGILDKLRPVRTENTLSN